MYINSIIWHDLRSIARLCMVCCLPLVGGFAHALDAKALRALLPKEDPRVEGLQKELKENRDIEKKSDREEKSSIRETIRDLQSEINQLKKDYRANLNACLTLLARVEQNGGRIHGVRDSQGRTLTMLVAALGCDEATRLVLADAPPLDAQDKAKKVAYDYERAAGGTAIEDHLKNRWDKAMQTLSLDEITKLIESGAGPDWLTGEDHSQPLCTAIQNKRDDVVMLLLAYRAKVGAVSPGGVSPMEVALEAHSVSALEMMLSAGASVEDRLSDGSTALDRMLQPGYEALLETWCMHTPPPRSGISPLCVVVRRGSLQAVQRCAAVCESVLNTEDAEGNLPLHEAARRGDADIYRALVAAGADPAAPHSRGETVLMHSALSGSKTMLELVLAGASPALCAACDKKGKSAIHYARLAKDPAAERTLKNAGITAQAGD